MAKTTGSQRSPKDEYNFLKNAEDSFEGFEDINASTMAIPFVRMLQKLSPQLDKRKPDFIEGAEEGDFFNTVTKEIYGPAINVVVLKFEHIYIEWRPDRGGFVSYHTPENAERLAVDKTFGHWKTVEGNDLAESYVYMIVIEGHESEGVHVFSASSTGIKSARAWNKMLTSQLMDNGERAKPYYIIWTLQQKPMENDQGSWYSFEAIKNRYITPEVYEIVSNERKMLPARQIDYAAIDTQNRAQITEDTDGGPAPY